VFNLGILSFFPGSKNGLPLPLFWEIVVESRQFWKVDHIYLVFAQAQRMG
jgi:hypothetical protein